MQERMGRRKRRGERKERRIERMESVDGDGGDGKMVVGGRGGGGERESCVLCVSEATMGL